MRTVSVYTGSDFNSSVASGGELIGQLSVDNKTTLQALGMSINNYVKDLQNYSSYKLKLTSGELKRPPPGVRGMITQNTVEIIIPNDLYVSEYSNLTIGNLRTMLPGSNMTDPIRVDIGGPLSEGLGKYVWEF